MQYFVDPGVVDASVGGDSRVARRQGHIRVSGAGTPECETPCERARRQDNRIDHYKGHCVVAHLRAARDRHLNDSRVGLIGNELKRYQAV